jgi:phosphate:Na+ symporter
MGANIGTTITSWILSLGGISSDNIFMQLLKPTSFTPVLALIGIAMTMISKTTKKKDVGNILLGFATLMFGMDTMSGAVKGLADVPEFQQLFTLFKNPILGVVVGAILTAVIQSSSASVGILQALSATGQVSFGAAIPIIMGQNIGTCVTALLSSFGANKNGKRVAIVHLSLNVIGTIVCLSIFSLVSNILKPAILDSAASHLGIAVAHSCFNIICTLILYPAATLLEKLSLKIVPQTEEEKEEKIEIDERLLATPSIALDQCNILVNQMADATLKAYKQSLSLLDNYDEDIADKVRKAEKLADKYEDTLGTFLAKLSTHSISDSDSRLSAVLLKVIGDFERISDHAVNIVEAAEELKEKGIDLTTDAEKELKHIINAVEEILDLSYNAFVNNDYETATKVEPLEQVIDELKEYLRDCHIRRLQRGECTIEAGFVWSDLLTNLERTSDHCSNIALCIIDAKDNNMNHHASGKKIKKDKEHFVEQYYNYAEKYSFKD